MQQQQKQNGKLMMMGRAVRDISRTHPSVGPNNHKIVIQYNNEQCRQNTFRKGEGENRNPDMGSLDMVLQGIHQHHSPDFKDQFFHKRTISLHVSSEQHNNLRILQRSNGINMDIKKEGPLSNPKPLIRHREKQNAMSPRTKIEDKFSGKLNFQSPEKIDCFTNRNLRNQSFSKDPRGYPAEPKMIISFQKKETIISGKQKFQQEKKNTNKSIQQPHQQSFTFAPHLSQNHKIIRTHSIMETPSLKHLKIQSSKSQKQNEDSKKISQEQSLQYSFQQVSIKKNSRTTLFRDFKIQDFIVGAMLGKGKFGQVYLTKHKETGFVCALKKIKKSTIREQKLENQLIRELKIQSYLYNPNIVNLYGFFSDEESVYILLELCSGGELYKLLRKKRRLEEEFAAYIIKQVCQATRYLHNNYVLHRDIKPENIIFQNGVVKLCDFGWAVSCHDELRKTLCGTPLYLSPEILKGDEYDYSTDIWTIGVLTYELLIGSIPFKIWSEVELNRIIDDRVEFPTWVDLTDAAKDFIMKILQKNPKQRITVQQLLNHPFLLSAKQSIKYFL